MVAKGGSITTKNQLADVLLDGREAVLDLEELWDDIQFDEGLDAEESENHPVRQRLMAARARLESVQQAVSRDARIEVAEWRRTFSQEGLTR